ncbi:MAG: NAD-dependent deacetylase [Chitinophagales bacterium]
MQIIVLTGAGISAESGIPTFRGAGGLWEGHRVEDVASPGGWMRDKELVLQFYNERRKAVKNANPNKAHVDLAALEKYHQVQIITQNIDDLHERAGSKNVLHLHGEIFKSRSVKNENKYFDCTGDILLGDLAADGGQLRPHIVWFGEQVPMMEPAMHLVAHCEMLIIVGTSMVVYPAASLLYYAPHDIPVFVVNPEKPEINKKKNMHFIERNATEGVAELITNELKINL